MSDRPLSEHGLLSNGRSAALVAADGSVDWLCLPRFDSAPVFARLLDDGAGHFRVGPADSGWEARWRYRPCSLVLETTWSSPRGELVVIDALALGPNERDHELGLSAPPVLLRRARCTRGSVAVRVDFAPRPEFGVVRPRLLDVPGGVAADGGAEVYLLSTDAPVRIEGSAARGMVELRRGQELTFALERRPAWGSPGRVWRPGQIRRRLVDTERAWWSWADLHQRYQGPYADLVHRSGLVLRGLTYARSGAVVAAPTTSLPEGERSGRTWDYRYLWVRDASMTQQGLTIAACPEEAERFFSFLARSATTQLDQGRPLQIMFGVEGESDLSERELGHLTGWRGSGPVRVGNGAWTQQQLDVYGAVLDAAYTMRSAVSTFSPATKAFLVSAVEAAAGGWAADDQGIWEMRGPARPFLHSKLMCWVALDRGLLLAGPLGVDARTRARWTRIRTEIHDAITGRGWNEQVGAFTQYFGSDRLDASVLMLVLVGFLPPDDPRLRATIDVVERELSDQRGLLFRYAEAEDGFAEPEGSFLLCTFWLAQALAMTDQTERARTVLDRAAGYANDLGLFAEQVSPDTGELLGNFPQAFSHLGLVNAAQALAEAESRCSGRRSERSESDLAGGTTNVAP